MAIILAIIVAMGVAMILPWLRDSFRLDADLVVRILGLGGTIFLNLLRMIVVPLVMASVASGILGMGDIRRLGKPGLATVTYYLATTLMAVVLGLLVVNIIQPGVGSFNQEQLAQIVADNPEVQQLVADKGDRSVGDVFQNLLLMLFTDNLVRSAAEVDLLPLIAFSIVFAGLLTTLGSRVTTLSRTIIELNEALLAFVMLVMKVAPIGIFCLVAAQFGQARLSGEFGEELRRTGGYVFAVLSGLGIHAIVTLPLLYYLFTRKNPYRYMVDMVQAVLTAFATASSSATLPVTIETAQRAGVSKQSTDFVLPLGATVNMDGTALYEAAAALFIAQAIGLELGLIQQVIIALTATLAAIGAAGIPQAGLVTMIIVLNAVGLPVEYMALIISVDWFLDRFRTAVNVMGDAMGAAIVDPLFSSSTAPNLLPEATPSEDPHG